MFSDEQLTAYLDGELPNDQAAEIRQALSGYGDLADRLKALSLDQAALQAAFLPLLDQAPEMSAARRSGPGKSASWSRDWPRSMLMTAGLCALVVGLGVGWALFSPRQTWQGAVAQYQALYVTDTLAPIAPDPAQIAAQLVVAGNKLGLRLDADLLAGFDGLTLRRAQVLGFEGRTLVQVAYTEADGTPVAFCILTRDGAGDSGLNSQMLSGLATASWQSDRHGFLTIGGQDLARMQGFAAYLQGVL